MAFVGDELRIGGLTKRAFGALETARPVLAMAALTFSKHHNATGAAAVKKVLAEQPYNEKWAKEEREAGFPTLNRHMLISLWGAVEVALEDTFVEIFIHDSAAIDALKTCGFKPPKDIATPPSEADARRCYPRATKLFEGPSFSGRVSKLFATLGLPLGLKDADASVLDEVNAVRNALLHRGGYIDVFATIQAPSLKPLAGKVFVVDDAFLSKAHPSISELAVLLLTAAGAYIKGVVGAAKSKKSP